MKANLKNAGLLYPNVFTWAVRSPKSQITSGLIPNTFKPGRSDPYLDNITGLRLLDLISSKQTQLLLVGANGCTLAYPRAEDLMSTSAFIDIGEYPFEELCCDLFAEETGISVADLYGVRGQRQYGIDIRARVSMSVETEVGQCKCYKQLSASDLAKAVEKFRSSKAHWATWKIRRFILFAACSVTDRKIQDEYQQQFVALHEDENILFELWGDEQIARRLRKFRHIAERYFSPEVVRSICGSALSHGAYGSLPAEAAHSQALLISECTEEFQEEASSEIPEIRQIVRMGQPHKAQERIERLLQSPRWTMLGNKRIHAQALRLGASLALDTGNISEAEEYLAKGLALNSGESFDVVEAALTFRKSGAGPALRILSAPKDVHEFNVRLAILLQDAHPEDVIREFDTRSFEPNGETFRLASIASVLLRDHPSAGRYSEEGLKLSPTWYLVRVQAARVKYLACVLPHFPAWPHIEWPIPPDPEYLRIDSESLSRLHEASEEFRGILATLETSHPEQHLIEIWLLACLACDPRRHGEARKYVSQLFSVNPVNVPAAIWAVLRGFEFDAETFLKTLKHPDNWHSLSPDGAQTMVNVFVPRGQIAEAIDVMDHVQPTFDEYKISFAWRLVRAQLAALANDQSTVEQLIKNEPDTTCKRNIRLAVLRTKANHSGDFTELGSFVAQCYEETKNPEYLFESCETWLVTKQPKRVLEHSEELLALFPSSQALRLVLHGAFEAGEFEEFLRILDKNREFFLGGAIPSVISRMEIQSRQMIGDLLSAAQIAESLAIRDPDTLNLFILFHSQVAIGDFRAGAITARKLVDCPEISPAGLLHIAQVVQAEDRELAVRLWSECVKKGAQDDGQIWAAITSGYNLGLDQQLGPLLGKLPEIASKPNSQVKALHLAEGAKFIEEQRQCAAEGYKEYRRALVPLHIATHKLGPYSLLFLGQAQRNRDSGQPLIDPPIFIRAGGCIAKKPPGGKMTRVLMDISSLLMMDFLELLETAEKAFSPILISASAPSFFAEQIQKASPHQPKAQCHRDHVLTLVEKGRIQSFSLHDLLPASQETALKKDLLISFAVKNNGLFCNFAADGSDASDLDQSSISVSDHEVIDELYANGHIQETTFNQIRRSPECPPPPNGRPDIFSKGPLVLAFGLAEHFASLGIIDLLSDLKRIFISKEEINDLKAEAEQHCRSQAVVARLKTLADKVQTGIRAGVYKTVRTNTRHSVPSVPPETAEERCLRDLVDAKGLNARLALCDDRFVSQHKSVGGVSSLCCTDVLAFLRTHGFLSDEDYYRKMLRLIESNARYISITKDLLVYFVNKAPISNAQLGETHDLAAIRRYVAACCANKEMLNPPPQLAHNIERKDLGEMEWVICSVKEACNAIASLWEREGMDNISREAKADWLLNNIVFPVHAVVQAQCGSSATDSGFEGTAGTISLLFSSGFALNSPWGRLRGAQNTPRSLFYRWFDSRLLQRSDSIEPRLVDRFSEIEVKSLFSEDRCQHKDAEKNRAERALLIKAFIDSPPRVQLRMALGPIMKKWLGIKGSRRLIGAFGHDFDAKELWEAVLHACNGKVGRCRSIHEDVEFEFPPRDPSLSPDRLYVKGRGLPESVTLSGLPLQLASDIPNVARSFLISRPEWFDVGKEQTAQTIESIISEGDPVRRFSILEDAREMSAEYGYQRLVERLSSHESIDPEDCLPPSSISILNHLRLLDEGFSKSHPNLEACACRLISEIGLHPAIVRFAALPKLLPKPFWEALGQLNKKDLQSLVHDLEKRLLSPVARLHLIHILVNRADVIPGFIESAKSYVSELLSDASGEEKWLNYTSILDWVRREFAVRNDFRHLDSATKLVLTWLHAGRICDIFLSFPVEGPRLRDFFGNAAIAAGIDMDTTDDDFWFDSAHPRHIERTSFLFRGMGAILDEINGETANHLIQPITDCLKNVTKLHISNPVLLRQVHLQKNILSSFLGGDSTRPYKAIFQRSDNTDFQVFAPGALIDQAIEELSQQPASLKLWLLLAHVLGDTPLPDESEAKLSRVIEQTPFFEILKHEDDQIAQVLYFACSRISPKSAPSTQDHLKRHVFRMIVHYSEQTRNTEAARVKLRLSLAINCIASLARTVSKETDLFKNYHLLFQHAAQLWPKLRSFLLQALGGWPSNRPLLQQEGLWELILWLRATA